MHHNIPHRLQSQMVMRATNCAVCLDSIHFGRQVSVCQDCGASAHAKCASHLPSTCGLPMGLAEHFGNVLGQETSSNPQGGESIQPSSSFHIMKGWVKIPRPGKATCWDRKFMKVFLFILNYYLFYDVFLNQIFCFFSSMAPSCVSMTTSLRQIICSQRIRLI